MPPSRHSPGPSSRWWPERAVGRKVCQGQYTCLTAKCTLCALVLIHATPPTSPSPPAPLPLLSSGFPSAAASPRSTPCGGDEQRAPSPSPAVPHPASPPARPVASSSAAADAVLVQLTRGSPASVSSPSEAAVAVDETHTRPSVPFDDAITSVGPDTTADEHMGVVEVATQTTPADGAAVNSQGERDAAVAAPLAVVKEPEEARRVDGALPPVAEEALSLAECAQQTDGDGGAAHEVSRMVATLRLRLGALREGVRSAPMPPHLPSSHTSCASASSHAHASARAVLAAGSLRRRRRSFARMLTAPLKWPAMRLPRSVCALNVVALDALPFTPARPGPQD